MTNSPARSAIDVGTVIAGTYTVDALIGRGGMGSVFLASHNRLPGKKVAIKLLHAEISNDDVLARFKREADIASRLDHPNIVKVDDYDVLPDGTPYIRMEYLQGESLAQRLSSGPLPLEQTMSIARQIGSALAAAHRAGIVHRDLKPQNIFLVPSELEGQSIEIAKVLDFGISKIRGSQTVKTQDSALLGTPQYMAPEQATGQHDKVDERTDVFALGAIVYEMIAGRPAFDGASIPEVVFKVVYEQPAPLEGVAPPLAQTIARAMAKAQAERYANVAEFIEALTGRPLTVARSPSSLPPPDGGPTTGSKVKSTGQDAFAQTMGSGDHGSQVAPAPVRGSAPTVDSQTRPPAGEVVAAEPPRRRPVALIFTSVIAAAGLAAGVVYFAMRGHDEPATEDKVEVVTVPVPIETKEPDKKKPEPEKKQIAPDKKPPEPEKKPPEPDKKQVQPDKKKPPEPEKKPPEPEKKPPEPVDTGSAEPLDETAQAKLQDAEVALRSHQLSRVEQLANSVINGESAGPKQKQHAHLLHGIVACTANNDQEHAQIDLRAIRMPNLRKRLIEACHAAGVTLQD